ncbi:hypothetical protein Dsin_016916 [Dipteronia sinensis]|uniref:alanine--glyoxylate transaminase n=1 Tax=Dipteronia sinensis TaxID=43782 RepID=A0AAE0E6G5_9ROSI|nr:hypothetical protein Dsin_016916 [Dipteronia sinensis]
MTRFLLAAAKRALSETNSQLFRRCCCFSRLAQKEEVAVENTSEGFLRKLPPFDYSPPPYTGPSAADILAKRKAYLSPSLFHFYNKPLNIVDGKMQYMFDESGRRYLDAYGGIATVCCGHCHPDVVKSITNQINRIQHTTVVYLNHNITDFAEALASKMPGKLKVVFFTNSGTEANEMAMMIARLYTGCNDIISVRNAYHGNAAGTMGATAQCNWKFNVVQTGVHHAVNPDPYRGVFGSDGEKYAKDVQDLIDFGTSGHVAGFISETIQGVGGIIEHAPNYLPAVYQIIKKAGGLCIADEVQCGFGRTGSHFWGFETQGVVPDIVTMAKGIGNGIPLGAVVTTPEVAEVLPCGSYFNTFGGNPDKYEIIGDVRGRGMMLGVELVSDRQQKTPPAKAETTTQVIMDHMKELGVLIGKGGFHGNVFRITPPLCFTKDDADYLVDAMDYTLSKM